jgi:hypothetical protein
VERELIELTYAKWQYWVCRKWQTSVKNKYELIGFVTTVASFGKDGANCYPLNVTLEMLGNVSRSTVQRLRKQCVDLGLFTETGKTYKGVRKLEISIPADDIEPIAPSECYNPGSCECKICEEWRVRFYAYQRANERRAMVAMEAKQKQPEPAPLAEPDRWADAPF